MNKTTALTFVAAVFLLAASLAMDIYGHESAAGRKYAAREVSGYATYDDEDAEPGAWERASGLAGFLSLTLALVGAMLWDREDAPPHEARRSVLMLDGCAARQVAGVSAPSKSPESLRNTLAAGMPVCESSVRSPRDESLTPLERVLRG
jgi:hypothetical protein